MSSSDLFHAGHAHRFSMRTLSEFPAHDFLHAWVARDIKDRLADITRQFSSVLLSGYHTVDYFGEMFPNATVVACATPDILHTWQGQFDLIISMDEMHRANDLPGLLIQMRRALKPDGVMMSAFAGGETLHQLRSAVMHGEMMVLGGASPRVFPFTDTQQMAGLMQRAGFSLPVIDSEILTVSYRDMFHLIEDIRGMGASNSLVNRYKSFTPLRVFSEAARYYQEHFAEEDGRVAASFEIIFLIGWAPHESQQKPARRGSGQISLTTVLES